jgi:hypothetical protein
MAKILLSFVLLLVLSTSNSQNADKPRVIISTDIGGSDPDDYQSMVHFLLYADRFEIEGLVSSPPKQGRKEHIEEVIHAYKQDFKNLRRYSKEFPNPALLFKVTKQGATNPQHDIIPQEFSEGAQWIVKRAMKKNKKPLYILVWGSITDVAQAVHRVPEIKKYIRVYSIGSWNTVQDEKSRDYLYNNHPDLWWIENNTTFRGMYMGGYQENSYGNLSFTEKNVKGYGALGNLFWEKKKDIKMGDTPSVLYMLHGDPNHPEGASWGGAFVKTGHGENYWTDNMADSLIENGRHGARTVNLHRREYLDDWAKRMNWLKD